MTPTELRTFLSRLGLSQVGASRASDAYKALTTPATLPDSDQ